VDRRAHHARRLIPPLQVRSNPWRTVMCRMCHRDNLVSISPDSTFGKRIISQAVPVGSFEDHTGIEKTFHGLRILKGNAAVNQSLSSSFDPSNLNCVCCKSEHLIVGAKPISVCFTDQNFVPSLPSNDGGCVSVVRVENSSLLELLDMAKEIFANVRIPEGSVFLFGSASHMNRCRKTTYVLKQNLPGPNRREKRIGNGFDRF
jgi:hypothetical protein